MKTVKFGPQKKTKYALTRRTRICWRSKRQNKESRQVKPCTGATSSGGFLKQPACEQSQAAYECFTACEQFQVNTTDSREQCFVNISKWNKYSCIMRGVYNNKENVNLHVEWLLSIEHEQVCVTSEV